MAVKISDQVQAAADPINSMYFKNNIISLKYNFEFKFETY